MLRIPHCLYNRLTVNCEILGTSSSTYSPVRTSQEAHSVSIKSCPRNRPLRPIGLWYVEDPTLSRQSAHRWRWYQNYAQAMPSSPQVLLRFCYLFMLESTQGLLRREGLGELKKCKDFIVSWTRDLPTSSIVSQTNYATSCPLHVYCRLVYLYISVSVLIWSVIITYQLRFVRALGHKFLHSSSMHYTLLSNRSHDINKFTPDPPKTMAYLEL
jgi:hypothetical protein